MVVALALAASACAESGSPKLLVSAASSLIEPLRLIEADFEATHDVDVVLNFGGSSTLKHQILEGAPVDVFISASKEIMSELVTTDRVQGEVVDVASNVLKVVVSEGNPAGITSSDDLKKPGVAVGACHQSVPCGALADEVLDFYGLSVTFATREPSVASVMSKVLSGDLDAGLVYVTDHGVDVVTVEVLDRGPLRTEYQMAVVDEARSPELAGEFVEFVTSPDGQRRLSAAGFGAP